MKPLIIAIVGESGSGKTTLAQHLKDALGIPYVVSYTTRPMRPGETNGREHWFLPEMPIHVNETLAYTKFGGFHYWTVPEQIDNDPVVTYVIDELGLIELKHRWSDKYDVLAVKIVRPFNPTDMERRNRDLGRVPYSDYALTIVNDSTLPIFLKRASHEILNQIHKHLL